MRILASLFVFGALATVIAIDTRFVALSTDSTGTSVVAFKWNDTVPNTAEFIQVPTKPMVDTIPEVDGGAYTAETRTFYSVLQVKGYTSVLVAWVKGEPTVLYDFAPHETMRGLYYDKTSQSLMGVCGSPQSATVLYNARPCQYVPSTSSWNKFGPATYSFEAKQHSWSWDGAYLVRLTDSGATTAKLWGCVPSQCQKTIKTYPDTHAGTRTTCYDGSSQFAWVGMSLEKEFWDLSQHHPAGDYRPTGVFIKEKRYEVNSDLCAWDDTNMIYIVDLPDNDDKHEVLVAKGTKLSPHVWTLAGRFRLPEGVRISNPQYGSR